MTGICKSGLLVLQDAEGVTHYFDPCNSLRDVANYIYNNMSLDYFRVNNESFKIGATPHRYVEGKQEQSPRLRGRLSMREDPYFMEP